MVFVPSHTQVDVIIIGAGAAGLMCAIQAGKRGRRTVVLEHNQHAGAKILISGGGRCNFTNLHTTPAHFQSENPHFAKSALARYGPQDFVRLIQQHGIAYHEKTAGQLFCDRSAREIVAMLGRECAGAGAEIVTACRVGRVISDSGFTVETPLGTWCAASLVVATGGLSIPKIGASDFGYTLARQFGLAVVPCRPALVPFTFSHADSARYQGLAGVSADSAVVASGHRFRDKLLFTHRGISGPAALQASSFWTPGECLEINLMPETGFAGVLRQARASGDRSELRTIARRFLPQRLADRWFEAQASLPRLGAISDRQVDAIAASFHHWRLIPGGTEGYAKAEVTAGGIDTAELSSQTFETRKVPGLYWVGEVVDVTGQLGGFNFQWAWASGFAAGQAV
jgi:hypothetical protein